MAFKPVHQITYDELQAEVARGRQKSNLIPVESLRPPAPRLTYSGQSQDRPPFMRTVMGPGKHHREETSRLFKQLALGDYSKSSAPAPSTPSAPSANYVTVGNNRTIPKPPSPMAQMMMEMAGLNTQPTGLRTATAPSTPSQPISQAAQMMVEFAQRQPTPGLIQGRGTTLAEMDLSRKPTAAPRPKDPVAAAYGMTVEAANNWAPAAAATRKPWPGLIPILQDKGNEIHDRHARNFNRGAGIVRGISDATGHFLKGPDSLPPGGEYRFEPWEIAPYRSTPSIPGGGSRGTAAPPNVRLSTDHPDPLALEDGRRVRLTTDPEDPLSVNGRRIEIIPDPGTGAPEWEKRPTTLWGDDEGATERFRTDDGKYGSRYFPPEGPVREGERPEGGGQIFYGPQDPRTYGDPMGPHWGTANEGRTPPADFPLYPKPEPSAPVPISRAPGAQPFDLNDPNAPRLFYPNTNPVPPEMTHDQAADHYFQIRDTLSDPSASPKARAAAEYLLPDAASWYWETKQREADRSLSKIVQGLPMRERTERVRLTDARDDALDRLQNPERRMSFGDLVRSNRDPQARQEWLQRGGVGLQAAESDLARLDQREAEATRMQAEEARAQAEAAKAQSQSQGQSAEDQEARNFAIQGVAAFFQDMGLNADPSGYVKHVGRGVFTPDAERIKEFLQRAGRSEQQAWMETLDKMSSIYARLAQNDLLGSNPATVAMATELKNLMDARPAD